MGAPKRRSVSSSCWTALLAPARSPNQYSISHVDVRGVGLDLGQAELARQPSRRLVILECPLVIALEHPHVDPIEVRDGEVHAVARLLAQRDRFGRQTLGFADATALQECIGQEQQHDHLGLVVGDGARLASRFEQRVDGAPLRLETEDGPRVGQRPARVEHGARGFGNEGRGVARDLGRAGVVLEPVEHGRLFEHRVGRVVGQSALERHLTRAPQVDDRLAQLSEAIAHAPA